MRKRRNLCAVYAGGVFPPISLWFFLKIFDIHFKTTETRTDQKILTNNNGIFSYKTIKCGPCFNL